MFDYPERTRKDRILPKNKVYGNAHPSNAVRQRFVNQVEQIVWRNVLISETVRHIYFVAETKGSMSSMEFRKIEETKIECARKFFSRITSDQVKYGVVNSYAKLMELVQ
jgi:hypothetical protein